MKTVKFLIPFGTRCTTDSFLDKFNLRKFSSPISYSIAEFSSAIKLFDLNIEYIQNNIVEVDNNTILYNDYWRFTKKFYFIKNIKPQFNNFIYNSKSLIWNHHNLKSKIGIDTLIRRINRINNICLKNNNQNIFFFHISNILKKENIQNNIVFYSNEFQKFKFNKCNMIIILTISDIQKDTVKFLSSNNNIDFWIMYTESFDLLKSYKPNIKINYPHFLDNDIKNKNIPWNKLYSALKNFYSFDI